MLTKEASGVALDRLFRRKSVVDLGELCRTLETDSRMSVFRRLREFEYLTSYTHTGRYYTLSDIPRFDEKGLWLHEGIGFSKAGSLKNTVLEVVEAAPAGQTHVELVDLLRVRVHNTLLDLVREERIGRERVEKVYVYVGAESAHAMQQIAARREMLSRIEVEPMATLSPGQIIEVLVAAIRLGGAQVAPADVAKRLRARGVFVTTQQVQDVFLHHGLGPGKKTAK